MGTLKRLLIACIKFYQQVAPFIMIRTCRFTPSCSSYACEAISTKGPRRGLWLSFKRIMRCHPFSKPGYDPVR